MTEQHPITPPPELVQEWMHEASGQPPGPDARVIATRAARWGADMELEACCAWLVANGWFGSSNSEAICDLRAARRLPSLKAQALETLAEMREGFAPDLQDLDLLRRALEQLDD